MNLEIVYILILCSLIVIAILLGFNLFMDKIDDDKYVQDQLDEIQEKLDLILIDKEIKKYAERKNRDK